MIFRSRKLLVYFYLTMPFLGFSLFNIGNRGFRLDWAIAFLFIVLMTMQLLLGNLKAIKLDIVTFSLLLLIFFVSLSVFSPVLKGNPDYIINFFTTYMQFLIGAFLFFFVYQLALSDNELKLILKAIVWIQGLIAAFAVIQLIFSYFGLSLILPFTNPGRFFPHSGYEQDTGSVLRSMSTFSEPRQLGAFLLTGTCLVLSFLYGNIKVFRNKTIPFIIFIFIIAGTFSSLSTSAIFNMITFISFFFFYKLIIKRNLFKNKALFRFIVFLFGFIIIATLIYISPLRTTIATRCKVPEFDGLSHYFTVVPEKAHRWAAFIRGQRLGMEAFLSSPIFGVGLNNYLNFVNTGYENLIGPEGCHGPIRFLAQTGGLGAIGFGIFLMAVILELQRKNSNSRNFQQKELMDIGLLLIVASIIASFGSGIYSLTSTFFWSNLILVAMMLRCCNKEKGA